MTPRAWWPMRPACHLLPTDAGRRHLPPRRRGRSTHPQPPRLLACMRDVSCCHPPACHRALHPHGRLRRLSGHAPLPPPVLLTFSYRAGGASSAASATTEQAPNSSIRVGSGGAADCAACGGGGGRHMFFQDGWRTASQAARTTGRDAAAPTDLAARPRHRPSGLAGSPRLQPYSARWRFAQLRRQLARLGGDLVSWRAQAGCPGPEAAPSPPPHRLSDES